MNSDGNVRKLQSNVINIPITLNKERVEEDVITVGKPSSVLRMLSQCEDFLNEKTQMMYICDLLKVILNLTPKYHPEIAGQGV